MELVRLKKMPSREVLINTYPPDKALLLLPGKEEDAYQPPHRLPHDGERKTTFAQHMRPLVLKRKGEDYYEYDLHCIGINVVENDGMTLNQEKSDLSFSQIYYFIGGGAYQQIVVPPIDPTLPKSVRKYIELKYQQIEQFMADPQPENLSNARDLANYQRGLAEQAGGKDD